MAAAAVLALVWAVAGYFLFVDPQADSPRNADVLFVLAPAERSLDYAQELMRQGYAPTLAVSVPLLNSGTNNPAICSARRPYRVICFDPDPVTTQGEARALAKLSHKNGWTSAAVLT